MTRREFLQSFSLVGLWFLIKIPTKRPPECTKMCLPMCLKSNNIVWRLSTESI